MEWVIVQYHRRNTPTQLSNLTLSMFVDEGARSKSYPVLTTRVKAAETRRLLPIISDIFEELHDPTNRVDAHMVFVLRSLDTYFECLQSVDYLLPAKAQARFQDSVWSFLKRYSWLNAWLLEQI